MLETARRENDKLSAELEEINNQPSNFEGIAKRAETDIDKLKKTLLPQNMGK